MTAADLLRSRAVDVAAVLGFALAGLLARGVETAVLGAVLGFFVAKTVASVRRTVA